MLISNSKEVIICTGRQSQQVANEKRKLNAKVGMEVAE